MLKLQIQAALTESYPSKFKIGPRISKFHPLPSKTRYLKPDTHEILHLLHSFPSHFLFLQNA